MVVTIRITEIIKIGIGQTAEIGEHHTEEEVSMDKIIEEDHVMPIIIEMTLAETILETWKITEVTILEVDMDGIIIQ